MKSIFLLAILLVAFVAAGCGNAGGGAGEPNANAATTPPASSDGVRPGTPGAPPVTNK